MLQIKSGMRGLKKKSLYAEVYTEAYDGHQLRPHFLLSEQGLQGDAIFAWSAPCEVKTDQLVDWEDRLANDFIRAKSMIHFVGEFFSWSLREGVLIQRLFMAICHETLKEILRETDSGKKWKVARQGDDLFVQPAKMKETRGQRKLSVSIVTASPVSVLLHAGINIEPEGAPVPAVGLTELGVDPERFASEVLERARDEWSGMRWACAKVRPVF